MERLFQNIRYGVRMLARTPGFTLTAVLALALGIGANTAIFSLVDGVILRPLPYRDSERLVTMWERSSKMDQMSVAYPNFLDWRANANSFEYMAARQGDSFTLLGVDDPEQLDGSNVSADIFPMLGVKPMLGRGFIEADDKPGARKVVVISHALWERRFQKDPGIIGRRIQLAPDLFEVIGVLPPGFKFPITALRSDIFAPIGRKADEPNVRNRGNHPGIYVFAKLKPGITADQARAEMASVTANLSKQYPDTNTDQVAGMDYLHARVVRNIKPALLIMFGAVAFVLLIACANIANLLLARSAARSQEIAVRTALGAGRRHLFEQLLTESVLLSLLGGAAGVLAGYWALQGLLALIPANTPLVFNVAIDSRVLLFSFAISIATGVLFGIVPAIQVSRRDINDTLKEGGRRNTGDRQRNRFRSSLIVAEVALSLVLLIGAGLMIQSFHRLANTSPGVNIDNILTGIIGLRGDQYKEPHQLAQYHDRALEKLAALPGVAKVTAVTPLPLSQNGWQTRVRKEGTSLDLANLLVTDYARISPAYFETMGLPILKGRAFTKADREGSPKVAIIDETFARKHYSDRDPIGQRLIMGGGHNPETVLQIVGVSAHVKTYGVDAESRIEMYLPFAQNPGTFLYFALKTTTDPASLTSAVRAAFNEIDRSQPFHEVATMQELFDATTTTKRFASLLLSVFAGLALLLSAVGLYGVIAYSVTQRTHEIGVRVALGASKSDVLRLVLSQGMSLIVVGVVIGLVGAIMLTRVMSSLLFGVSATDPSTFVAVSAILAAVALLASYLPARKASKVDPMIALRYE